MRINQAGCNLKECRYFADYNCRDANRHATCPYARLHELEVQNRLYELPCAVGTPYWELVKKLFAQFGVEQCKSCNYFNEYDGTCDYIFDDEEDVPPCCVIKARRFTSIEEIVTSQKHFGKTIFLDEVSAQIQLEIIKQKGKNING